MKRTTQRLLLPMLLLALPAITASSGNDKEVAGRVAQHTGAMPKARQATRQNAKERQGVTATLRYEQIADMKTARISHQAIPTNGGIVVVGGRTTAFQLTKTAEAYRNGQWASLNVSAPHDGAFSVTLADGRTMVGGGFSGAGGTGRSKNVSIYNPQTNTFTSGPQMATARAMSNAIVLGGKVYVSGNWYADDNVMDCYDGTSFTAVGNMDGRSNPYLFVDGAGNVFSLSSYGTKGESFGFYTFDDGSQALLADRYNTVTGQTKYMAFPFTPQSYPTALPDDMRPADYHADYGTLSLYFILVKMNSGYKVQAFEANDKGMYSFPELTIPVTYEQSGQTISWRGGVIVNEAKQELYLIGASGTKSSQRLHIISFNYLTDEWTIATAEGFTHDLLTASWTLLSDGRLACTGGGINDNTDAQRKAYLFTTPVAGQGDGDTPDDPQVKGNTLVVTTKDGVQTTYLLSEKPEVRFTGQSLRVVSTKADVTYALKDILRFTYLKRSASGIDEVAGESTEAFFDDGTLVISNLKAGATTAVYSLDGKLVRQLTATHTGTYRLNLSSLPQGVYIVKADQITYKIMKR